VRIAAVTAIQQVAEAFSAHRFGEVVDHALARITSYVAELAG
jgi:hypothetical protein